MAVCFFCRKTLDIQGKVPFSAECPHCGMDVHVCRNCEFYEPGRPNDCREPMAEPVRDREKRNVCEYFVLAGGDSGQDREADEAKKKLEALFKK
jgi:hypothetical protein